jgi:uncharacterized protein YqgV (UPF0045/DUF77 family)
MSGIIAQVSIYALRQQRLSPSIGVVLQAFSRHGVHTQTGPMSTLIWGDDETIFAALRDAFQKAASLGETVMNVTISNACPLPEADLNT